MHISDGILNSTVSLSSLAVSSGIFLWSLKGIRNQDLSKTALMTAALFVGSLIHIPVGPSSVHLLLTGLAGILLGRGAYAALAIAVALQAMLFQFGGVTAIGANTIMMGIPALIAAWLFRGILKRFGKKVAVPAGAVGGAVSVLLASLFLALFLWITGEQFREVAVLAVTAQIPVMVIEAIITGFMAGFIVKVKPELLWTSNLTPDDNKS